MGRKGFGLVQMWWGDGKGKTTAALGMGFRAAGRGYRVHLIQFMKGGIAGVDDFEEYGEITAIKKFPNFTFERFGMPEWVRGEPAEEHTKAAREALKAAEKACSAGDYDMVIVDECLYAIQLGLIEEDDLLAVVERKADATEVVLTGSHQRLPKIEAAADLVTQVKKIKHPFDAGISARIGTEF